MNQALLEIRFTTPMNIRTGQGALLQSHFVYREGEKSAIDANVRWTLLDARLDEALPLSLLQIPFRCLF